VRQSVLIVDDNPHMRKLVRSRFESQSDFQICGEAENGQDAIEKAKQFKPDLIILDFSMPVMDGITAASILSQTIPAARLILFTMHSSPLVDAAARTAGISAVIAKEHGLEQLVSQVQTILGLPSTGRSLARGI
jgi:DNA-binding NarL/FixJ family response regulator